MPEIVQNHALIISMAIAGHDSTSSVIGSGMLGQLRFREQIQRLRDDPAKKLIPRPKTIKLAGGPKAKEVNFIWGLTSVPVGFTAA
jgi:hypothetical protein